MLLAVASTVVVAAPPAQAIPDYPVVISMAISPPAAQIAGRPVTFSVTFSSPAAPFPIENLNLGIVEIQKGGCDAPVFDSVGKIFLGFNVTSGSLTTTFAGAASLDLQACYYPKPGAPFLRGRSSLQPYVIKLDTTPPVVTGTPDIAANAAGWNSSPVRVSWSSVDPAPSSGTPTQPASTLVTTEGAGQMIVSGQSCDPAGNCSTGNYGPVNIDSTPPTQTITGVTVGAVYPLGSVPAAVCTTTDTLSGVADPGTVGLVREPAGIYWVSCMGSDIAGNLATSAFPYSVSVSTRAGRQGFVRLFNQYVAASPTPPKRSFIRNVTAAVNDERWCKVIRKIKNPNKSSLSAAQRADLTYWAEVARGGPCGAGASGPDSGDDGSDENDD